MEYDTTSKGLGFDRPSIARIYDYTLGGTANFLVDREAAEQWFKVFPEQHAYAYANRGFLRRAVAELCHAGFDQFLDLGSGIPTVGNVHEIAQKINPEARVAYIDIDPVAVLHARELLEMNGAPTDRVTSSDVDMRRPGDVLAASGVAGLLDFSRPVAVLMLGILDIIDTSETLPPADIVAAYRDACVPGSALMISNAAQLSISPETAEAVLRLLAETSTPTGTYRSVTDIKLLFAGYDVVPPGIVPTAAWRPDQPVTDEEALRSNALCGVGFLR